MPEVAQERDARPGGGVAPRLGADGRERGDRGVDGAVADVQVGEEDPALDRREGGRVGREAGAEVDEGGRRGARGGGEGIGEAEAEGVVAVDAVAFLAEDSLSSVVCERWLERPPAVSAEAAAAVAAAAATEFAIFLRPSAAATTSRPRRCEREHRAPPEATSKEGALDLRNRESTSRKRAARRPSPRRGSSVALQALQPSSLCRPAGARSASVAAAKTSHRARERESAIEREKEEPKKSIEDDEREKRNQELQHTTSKTTHTIKTPPRPPRPSSRSPRPGSQTPWPAPLPGKCPAPTSLRSPPLSAPCASHRSG